MSRGTDPTRSDALLRGYLREALECHERGEAVDVAVLCAGHPELVAEVAEALALAREVPVLHAQACEADALSGTLLAGRYELGACIGSGAMGAVFEAQDRELLRSVAVKLLHRERLAGEHAIERFAREAQALAAIDHPHVVRVFDRGVDGGSHFLVTELLRGIALRDVVDEARRAMPDGPSAAAFASCDWLRDALAARLGDASARRMLGDERSFLRLLLRWCADLAAGLGAAHAHGVLHRDVKPSNAWLTTDGRAVLLDFGIALREGDASLTLAGVAVGTPCYMAPEQVRGDALDARVDVYGLTATLYHLLALRPPFEGESSRVLLSLLTDDPPPLMTVHRGLPRDVRGIVERGLDRDPGARYANAGELEADLRAFLDHRPVGARPIGPLRRVARRIRRRPVGAAAIGTALVAAGLLAVAGVLWSERSASASAREHARLTRQLAGDLAIEGRPEQRILDGVVAETRGVLAQLDRLLELRPDDHGTRLLRIALRLDLGAHAAAAADCRDLAAANPSAYLAAVAARYASADSSLRGIDAVQLGGLPEPASELDCFVAGFHALRARDAARADELLARCGDLLPARDLRLLSRLGTGDFDGAYREALTLEGTYGFRTARTRHAIGAALLAQRRYHDAIAPLEEALALRPDRHGPLNNLGLAWLRLGDAETSKRWYERAHAVRPWFDNTLSGLAQVHRTLRDFAEARRWAEKIEARWWRGQELGNISLADAIERSNAGDHDGASAAARDAIAHLEHGLADPQHTMRAAAESSIELARAIASGDRRGAITAFLAWLRREPRDPHALTFLAGLLDGAELDADAMAALRVWLLHLAIDTAPQHPLPRERLRELLESSRSR